MPALLHKVIGFKIFFVFISSNICNTVAYKANHWHLATRQQTLFFTIVHLETPSMTDRTTVHGLQVATPVPLCRRQVLPGTGVDSSAFWKGFDAIVADLAPKNIALLAERDRLQTELDTWHKGQPRPHQDMVAYRKLSRKIGYLVPQPAGVKATTTNRGR